MSGNNDFDRLAGLWKEQEVEEMEIDIVAIEKKARSFARTITIRNAIEWAAGALLVGICGVKAAGAESVLEIASFAALALGAAFVSVYMFLKGRSERLPDPAVDTGRFARAHRNQLLAQSRLLRTAPLWYIAPLALGALGLIANAGIEVWAAGRGGMWIVISSGLICAATFCAVALLNLRKAAELKRRAESMDS